MKIKGVVFDFNGTLFWDTHYHDLAWDTFLEKHGLNLTKQEKEEKIHGKLNSVIFKLLFNNQLTEGQIQEMTFEKEKIYHQICLHNSMEYAPGALDFIKKLKSENIAYTIATSSGWENIDFYIKNMELDKWFDIDKLVYNDGSLKGKPDPDVFLKAIDILNVKPEETLIFEDSVAGIQSAQNSGAGKIIIVNSNNGNYGEFSYPVIQHFKEAEKFIQTF